MTKKKQPEKKPIALPHVESITVRTIIQLFVQNYAAISPKQLTTLHQLTRTLAKRFNETVIQKKLDRLQENVYNSGYALSILELAYYRDMMMGASTSKSYNYKGRTGSKINLANIVILCDKVKAELFDTFTEILSRHDIPFSAEALMQSGTPTEIEAL